MMTEGDKMKHGTFFAATKKAKEKLAKGVTQKPKKDCNCGSSSKRDSEIKKENSGHAPGNTAA